MDNENRESFALYRLERAKGTLKSAKIAQAQRVREDSDYDDKYQISYEKTEQQIKTAEEVIEKVEIFIKEHIK